MFATSHDLGYVAVLHGRRRWWWGKGAHTARTHACTHTRAHTHTRPCAWRGHAILYYYIILYYKYYFIGGGGGAGARLAQVGGARVLPGITFTARTLLDVKVTQLLMYGSTEASIEEAI